MVSMIRLELGYSICSFLWFSWLTNICTQKVGYPLYGFFRTFDKQQIYNYILQTFGGIIKSCAKSVWIKEDTVGLFMIFASNTNQMLCVRQTWPSLHTLQNYKMFGVWKDHIVCSSSKVDHILYLTRLGLISYSYLTLLDCTWFWSWLNNCKWNWFCTGGLWYGPVSANSWSVSICLDKSDSLLFDFGLRLALLI